MICQRILHLGFFLQSLHELLTDMNFRNVAVLKNDSILLEFLVELLEHVSGHVTLEIKDLTEPNSINENSNVFIDFSVEKLIESGSSQLVHKILYFSFLCWHSECEIEINRNIGVVFSWAISNLIRKVSG